MVGEPGRKRGQRDDRRERRRRPETRRPEGPPRICAPRRTRTSAGGQALTRLRRVTGAPPEEADDADEHAEHEQQVGEPSP